MAVFSVSYDLNKSDKNYEGLKEAIKKSGDWAHILGSTWLVSTSYTAQGLSDLLLAQMDTNDALFISKVNKGEYAGWLSKELVDWINRYVG